MKSVLVKTAALLSFSAVLTGCIATAGYVHGDYVTKDGEGVVVLSVNINDQCNKYGVIKMHVADAVGQAYAFDGIVLKKDIPLAGLLMKPKGSDGPFRSMSFPEGKHSLRAMTLRDTKFGHRSSGADDFAFFNVTAKQVTYLGELTFDFDASCESFSMSINDQWARDTASYQQMITNIPSGRVVKDLAVLAETMPVLEDDK